MAQGAFALADESLLVPLHPLELLVGAHLPSLPLHRVSRVQTLQGALWSLLRWVGGKMRVTQTTRQAGSSVAKDGNGPVSGRLFPAV